MQQWGGFIGQWDTRTWNKKEVQLPPRGNRPPETETHLEYTGLTPGYIKRAPVAWFASHCHNADGKAEPYAYSYLFAYEIPLAPGARTLTLPDNDKVRILAVSVAHLEPETRPAAPLYDSLEYKIDPAMYRAAAQE